VADNPVLAGGNAFGMALMCDATKRKEFHWAAVFFLSFFDLVAFPVFLFFAFGLEEGRFCFCLFCTGGRELFFGGLHRESSFSTTGR
jgi:hypothetical protein